MSLATLESQWTKLAAQQSATFAGAQKQLEQLIHVIEAMRDELTGEAASLQETLSARGTSQAASGGSVDLRRSLQRVEKAHATAKTHLTKEFKFAHTNLTNTSEKIEKTFATDLNAFCPHPLYASPEYMRSSEAHKNVSASKLARSATVAAFPPDALVSRSAANYARWCDAIMIETWLRDGRTELVATLRSEAAVAAAATAASQAASDASVASAAVTKNGPTYLSSVNSVSLNVAEPCSSDESHFQTMREMVAALQRRDVIRCLRWLTDAEAHTRFHQSRMEAALEKARIDSISPSDSTPHTARPKRVSFTIDAASHVSAELASPEAPSLASLSAARSSLASSLSSLRSLQFDCHRVHFLQILINAEQAARTPQRTQRKRKHTFDQTVTDVAGDSLMPDVQESNHSSSSSDSDSNGEQANGSQATSTATASYHAALKYAQSFFPPFIETHLDEIRKLSGCLLFLGQLTPANAGATLVHPYAAYFTRSGNRTLWTDLIHRVKSVCLQRMNKSHLNPMALSLRACDIALPQLVKYQNVLRLNHEMVAASNGAMPQQPEIDLGVDFQFHSTFVCPVTKEQCTTTASGDQLASPGAPSITRTPFSSPAASAHSPVEPSSASAGRSSQVIVTPDNLPIAPPPPHSNPPVMLKCGHCISFAAMENLARSMRGTRRFKCPTCPREQLPSEVTLLHL